MAEGEALEVKGRVLHLTSDPELLRRQLAGETLPYDPSRPLIDNISTDELTPGWVCYYYDETLARYCLVGLRGGVVEKDAVKNGGLAGHLSGASEGCGASRAAAPGSMATPGSTPLVALKSGEND